MKNEDIDNLVAQYAGYGRDDFYSVVKAAIALHSKQNGSFWLCEEQEPKYTVNGHAIVNRATEEEIPPDEPVFIFRARDALSVSVLRNYLTLISYREPRSEHLQAVAARIDDFERFARENPERMKWPDTTTS